MPKGNVLFFEFTVRYFTSLVLTQTVMLGKGNVTRASGFRLRQPGFESCAAMSKFGQVRSIDIASGHTAE